jgi:hypothetical protein
MASTLFKRLIFHEIIILSSTYKKLKYILKNMNQHDYI